MSQDLENKLCDQTKHHTLFYYGKEQIVGQCCQFLFGCAGAYALSSFANSNEYQDLCKIVSDTINININYPKEQIAVFTTLTDALGFQIGYTICNYFDRKNDFRQSKDFAKYLLKVNALVNIPAGIIYHISEVFGLYWLQHVGLNAKIAAPIAIVHASIIGNSFALYLASKYGFIKDLNIKKRFKSVIDWFKSKKIDKKQVKDKSNT